MEPGRVELTATGPLLSSLVTAWSWGTLSHRLQVGDLLLVHTDGVTEARSPTGEQYGADRLLALLAEATPDRAPDLDLDALLRRLLGDVTTHTRGRVTDDTTVVACRLTGAGF